jgi:hypothetical protein
MLVKERQIMKNKIRKSLNHLFKDMDKAYDKKPPKKDWKNNYRHIVLGEWKELGRQKDLILKVEELPDSNIGIIIDGKKLSTNASYGFVEINLLDEIEKFNEAKLLKGTTRRVSYLRRAVNRLKAVKQDAEELINNKQDVKKFLKENGFSSLELPQIKSYLRNLVNKLRDKKTLPNERTESESRLKSFITAFTYTATKQRIFDDFSIAEYEEFYDNCYNKARKFFKLKKEFCFGCKGKRRGCEECTEMDELKEYLNQKHNYKEDEIEKYLKGKNPSKYAEEITRKKFGIDRSQVHDYRKRCEALAPPDF